MIGTVFCGILLAGSHATAVRDTVNRNNTFAAHISRPVANTLDTPQDQTGSYGGGRIGDVKEAGDADRKRKLGR